MLLGAQNWFRIFTEIHNFWTACSLIWRCQIDWECLQVTLLEWCPCANYLLLRFMSSFLSFIFYLFHILSFILNITYYIIFKVLCIQILHHHISIFKYYIKLSSCSLHLASNITIKVLHVQILHLTSYIIFKVIHVQISHHLSSFYWIDLGGADLVSSEGLA